MIMKGGHVRMLVLLALFAARAAAQPVLHFNGISLAWPDVKLSLFVQCNGTELLQLSKRNFSITENGIPVNGFTISCPDSLTRCRVSVALVFDVSGSMAGDGIAGEKAAGKAFVASMDGAIDEASIFQFNGMVTQKQALTSNPLLLNAAIDQLSAAGSTAIWDACMAALRDLRDHAANPCRAMVVLTDGMDNVSSANVKQAIDLAVSLGIKVYTIGLGLSLDSKAMRDLGEMTGGSSHFVDDPKQLEDVYRLIASVIRTQTEDCEIHYTGTCIDGGARTVTVTVSDVCGGADTASLTFTAPGNIGRSLPLRLRAGRDTTIARGMALVRIAVTDSAINAVLPETEIVVRFDSTLLSFRSADIPPGALLPPGSIAVTQQTLGMVQLRITQRVAIDDTGTLCTLAFEAADPPDTALASVRLERCIFDDGCLVPALADGAVRIIPCRWVPAIDPTGSARLCAGDTIILRGPSGFSEYTWYRDSVIVSQVKPLLRITTPGRYYLLARDNSGCTGISESLDVRGVSHERLTAGSDETVLVAPGAQFEVQCRVSPPLERERLEGGSADLTWTSPQLTLLRRVWLPENAGADSISVLATYILQASGDVREALSIPLFFSLSLPNGCIDSVRLKHPSVLIDGYCEKLIARAGAPRIGNAPNPVRESALVSIDLDGAMQMRAVVIDAFGREVARLADGIFPEGRTVLPFHADGLAPGMYAIHATTSGGGALRPILVLGRGR
ncbi:MAG: VWA domain-containing protein [Ignavibacteria bacterium]|nr:VWA domain-containing protein [Ignavibacteria bacterium]